MFDWYDASGTVTWANIDASPTTITVWSRASNGTGEFRVRSRGVAQRELDERMAEFKVELARFLAVLHARRERAAELARVTALEPRRGRPATSRAPERRPKARSTSGSQRWRVRNPNA